MEKGNSKFMWRVDWTKDCFKNIAGVARDLAEGTYGLPDGVELMAENLLAIFSPKLARLIAELQRKRNYEVIKLAEKRVHHD